MARATGVTHIAPPAELFSLEGRVIVLTGASSGLGARWAPVLGAAGAHLVLTARREQELRGVAAVCRDPWSYPAT